MAEEAKKKSGWGGARKNTGGARPGAGRPGAGLGATVQAQFRLPKTVIEDLDNWAAIQNRPKTQIVIEAVLEWVDRREAERGG